MRHHFGKDAREVRCNLMSSIAVPIAASDRLVDLAQTVQSKLDDGAHLWQYEMFGVLARASDEVFFDVTAKVEPIVGTFSNLGAWQVASSNDVWLFAVPVTQTVPLAVGIVTVNGRLSACISAHSSIARGPKDCETVLSEWQRLL
jgi:hypothetical protein